MSSTRIGLPADSAAYDRRLVTRARVVTTDPATGRLVERVEVRIGHRRAFDADARYDHTNTVFHRIHC